MGKTLMDNSIKDLLNALGIMAETSLNFYRSLVQAGATAEEAKTLTQAYIAVMLYGGKGESRED